MRTINMWFGKVTIRNHIFILARLADFKDNIISALANVMSGEYQFNDMKQFLIDQDMLETQTGKQALETIIVCNLCISLFSLFFLLLYSIFYFLFSIFYFLFSIFYFPFSIFHFPFSIFYSIFHF